MPSTLKPYDATANDFLPPTTACSLSSLFYARHFQSFEIEKTKRNRLVAVVGPIKPLLTVRSCLANLASHSSTKGCQDWQNMIVRSQFPEMTPTRRNKVPEEKKQLSFYDDVPPQLRSARRVQKEIDFELRLPTLPYRYL